MESIDKEELPDGVHPNEEEENLLRAHVIKGDHKLFYLDAYLHDLLGKE